MLAGGGARHVLPMLTLRAGLAMWQGRHAEARAAVQRGLTETRSDDLVLLGVLAWHGLRAEAEAHTGGTVPVDPDAIRRLKVVVDRMARGVGNAAPPVRAVIDGYLDLCAAELSRIENRHDPAPWAKAAARLGPAQPALPGGLFAVAAGRGVVPAQDRARVGDGRDPRRRSAPRRRWAPARSPPRSPRWRPGPGWR